MSHQPVSEPPALKSERFEARLTPEQKQMLQLAATLEGCSMVDFVSQVIHHASIQTIEKHQHLSLILADSKKLAQALLNPPEPNDALLSAFTCYKNTFGQE